MAREKAESATQRARSDETSLRGSQALWLALANSQKEESLQRHVPERTKPPTADLAGAVGRDYAEGCASSAPVSTRASSLGGLRSGAPTSCRKPSSSW
jgi:hypothetical protein